MVKEACETIMAMAHSTGKHFGRISVKLFHYLSLLSAQTSSVSQSAGLACAHELISYTRFDLRSLVGACETPKNKHGVDFLQRVMAEWTKEELEPSIAFLFTATQASLLHHLPEVRQQAREVLPLLFEHWPLKVIAEVNLSKESIEECLKGLGDTTKPEVDDFIKRLVMSYDPSKSKCAKSPCSLQVSIPKMGSVKSLIKSTARREEFMEWTANKHAYELKKDDTLSRRKLDMASPTVKAYLPKFGASFENNAPYATPQASQIPRYAPASERTKQSAADYLQLEMKNKKVKESKIPRSSLKGTVSAPGINDNQCPVTPVMMGRRNTGLVMPMGMTTPPTLIPMNNRPVPGSGTIRKVTHRIQTMQLDDNAFTPLKAGGGQDDWTPVPDEIDDILQPKSLTVSPRVLFSFAGLAVFCITIFSLWRADVHNGVWFTEMATRIEDLTNAAFLKEEEKVPSIDDLFMEEALEEALKQDKIDLEGASERQRLIMQEEQTRLNTMRLEKERVRALEKEEDRVRTEKLTFEKERLEKARMQALKTARLEEAEQVEAARVQALEEARVEEARVEAARVQALEEEAQHQADREKLNKRHLAQWRFEKHRIVETLHFLSRPSSPEVTSSKTAPSFFETYNYYLWIFSSASLVSLLVWALRHYYAPAPPTSQFWDQDVLFSGRGLTSPDPKKNSILQKCTIETPNSAKSSRFFSPSTVRTLSQNAFNISSY